MQISRILTKLSTKSLDIVRLSSGALTIRSLENDVVYLSDFVGNATKGENLVGMVRLFRLVILQAIS